jgi:hypothetical protein
MHSPFLIQVIRCSSSAQFLKDFTPRLFFKVFVLGPGLRPIHPHAKMWAALQSEDLVHVLFKLVRLTSSILKDNR